MAAAAGAHGIPYVLTAHGQDVRNLDRRSLRRATAPALSRAAGLIAVSRHLADALGAAGLALPPVHVIDMGVDMERFAPGDRAAGAGPPGAGARRPAGAGRGRPDGAQEPARPAPGVRARAAERARTRGSRWWATARWRPRSTPGCGAWGSAAR